MGFRRNFIQARDLRKEAADKIKDYDSIIGRMKRDYESLRGAGIPCKAFLEEDGDPQIIVVTKQCWNHISRGVKRKRQGRE